MIAAKEIAAWPCDNIFQLVEEPICTGEDFETVLLSPKIPDVFIPQDHKVPSVLIEKHELVAVPRFDQFVNAPT